MRVVVALTALAFGPSVAFGQAVRSVDASGPGVWENPTLEEELRIGSLDGADQYVFGNVTFLAPMPDGSVFVADGQGPRLRLYSAEGEFIRDVGRVGEGPGEFRGIFGMDVTPQGELGIYDLSLQRISLFDASGEYLRSFRSSSGGSWISESFRVDSDGNFLVFTARIVTRTDPRSGRQIGIEGHPDNRSIYLRLSPSGEVIDSLEVPRPSGPREPGFVVMAPEGYFRPFTNDLVFALSPNGYIVSGRASEYVISRLDPSGNPVFQITRGYEPVEITPQERAQWQARADFYTRRGGASAGVTIPDEKPAFRELEVDEDGRIWVNRYAEAVQHPVSSDRPADAPPAISWRDVPTFDVFEASGRFLGTVTVPARTRILVRSGDRFWGVTRGEYDEPYVVRFRCVGCSG